MAQVIIFAPAHDIHASAVAWSLRRAGVEALVSSSLRQGSASRFAVLAGADGLHGWASDFQPAEVSAVWYRRPSRPGLSDQAELDRWFSAQQWALFQKNFLAVAHSTVPALWVNEPAASVAAESKLLQLRVAAEVGLDFPEALVTNDAGQVDQLIRRWGRVVFKTFQGHAWEDRATQRYYNTDVSVLDAASELPEAAIAFCPGIFQRYIEKQCDLRVTVIGERFFCARIERKSGGAYLDWRPAILDEDMDVQPFQLPPAVEARLRELMRRLGIVFGCIDLVMDGAGRLFFLEVNQQGQFLFIEKMLPALPLLQAASAMLAGGRTDYALDGRFTAGFEAYLDSADYQQALAAPIDEAPPTTIEPAVTD